VWRDKQQQQQQQHMYPTTAATVFSLCVLLWEKGPGVAAAPSGGALAGNSMPAQAVKSIPWLCLWSCLCGLLVGLGQVPCAAAVLVHQA
jgi:hypothetical protein